MKLKRSLFFALVGLCLFNSLLAQEAEFKVMAETDGSTVKLGWLPKVWPSGLEGLVIKRSIDGQNWTQITETPVIPGFDPVKPLQNVEKDKRERQRLSEKQKRLIDEGLATVKTTQFYFDEVLNDQGNLNMLAFVFGSDYDIMRLSGFGLIDREAPASQQVHYALHAYQDGKVIEDPIQIFDMNTSNVDSLDLAMKSAVEITASKKEIIIQWKYAEEEFKNLGFKSFNIYQIEGKRRKKLNENAVLVAGSGDSLVLSRRIPMPDGPEIVHYEARPLTQLEFEGKGAILEVDPAELVSEASAPVMKSIALENGIMLVWDAIGKGSNIEIQRKERDKDYLTLAVLNSDAVSYQDATVEQGGTYVYRLIVHLSNKRPDIVSKEVFVSLRVSEKPDIPKNVKAELSMNPDEPVIILTWDGQPELKYRVYIDSPFGSLAHDSSLPDFEGSQIIIPVTKSRSEVMNFAIQAIDEKRNKSELSEIVKVVTPTSILPPLKIWPIRKVEEDVVLFWDYSNEIADLEGFNLYMNGELISENGTLDKNARNVRVRDLQPGDHTFEIEAVTQFGLTTKSGPVLVAIELD